MAHGISSIVASSQAVDPMLAALFDSSAGPAKLSKKPRYAQPQQPKEEEDEDEDSSDDDDNEEEDEEENDDDDDNDDIDSDEEKELSDNDSVGISEDGGVPLDQGSDSDESLVSALPVKGAPVRKRKRGGDSDDRELEARYFEKLAKSEAPKPAEKKRKGDDGQPSPAGHKDGSGSSDEDDNQSDGDGFIPVHEAVAEASQPIDLTKDEAARTVYLANISTEAVVSKSGKTTLTAHLRSVLDSEATPAQRLEKLRFRSLPVSSTKIPKRAAFITRSLLDSTTKAAQGYAVYSTQAAARIAARELNGTIVLGRHLRADLNAHPDEKDHRRCVFVGNLNFVDDEVIVDTNEAGESVTHKKSKVPADAEEGLWRTFMSKAGPVEFVRVPRDPNTRVGKGFAYVQFKDGTSVEKALLLNDRKFPPMLPRPIRVSRCKDPRKTLRAVEKTKARTSTSMRDGANETKYRPKITPDQKSDMGRAGRLLGKGGAAMVRRGPKPVWKGAAGASGGRGGGENGDGPGVSMFADGIKTPQQVVLEGRRASEKDGRPAGMKFGKGKGKSKGKKGGPKGGRPENRGTRRAAEWRKSSGDK